MPEGAISALWEEVLKITHGAEPKAEVRNHRLRWQRTSSIDMKTRACTFAPREDRRKLPGHRPPRACAAQTAPAAKRAFGSITREPFRPLCQPSCQMGPPEQRITHAAPTVAVWRTACAWCVCAHATPGPTRALSQVVLGILKKTNALGHEDNFDLDKFHRVSTVQIGRRSMRATRATMAVVPRVSALHESFASNEASQK